MDSQKHRSITPTLSTCQTGGRNNLNYDSACRSVAKGNKPRQNPINNLPRNPNGRNCRGNREFRYNVRSSEAADAQNNFAYEVSGNTNRGAKAKKKWNGTDASHLLNFRLERRPLEEGLPLVRQRRWQNAGPIMTKDDYLQANCQFVVGLSSDDIQSYLTDPDKLVEWKYVQQVRMYDDQPASCPICLDNPVAPRITMCAHVYCLPCILHHLSLAERAWARCPICNDPVEQKDLKRVSILASPSYQVGDKIDFKLMRRERNSHYVRPAEVWDKSGPSKVFKLHDDECDIRFSKLLWSTLSDTEIALLGEKKLLSRLLTGSTDKTESTFIRAAMNTVNAELETIQEKMSKSEIKKVRKNLRKDKYQSTETLPPEASQTREDKSFAVSQDSLNITDESYSDELLAKPNEFEPDTEPDQQDKKREDAAVPLFEISSNNSVLSRQTPVSNGADIGTRLRSSNSACSSVDSGVDGSTEAMASDLLLPPTGTQPLYINRHTDITEHGEEYYFYQVKDGQPLYLHSLNTRILATQYGSVASAPHTIQGTIVEMYHSNMTKSLRNKLGYLSHLPIYSTFSVVEISMLSPLVSPKVLENYRDEMNARKKARTRRSRSERVQERKAAEREKRKMGKYSPMSLPLNSEHFPQNSIIEGDPFFVASSFPTPTPQQGARPTAGGKCPSSTSQSFAMAMKSEPTVSVPVWPRKPAVKLDSPTLSSAVKPELSSARKKLSPPKDEDNVPTYQQSFKEGFDALFDQLDIQVMENEKGDAGGIPKKGRGKQRGKKISLSSNCGYNY